MGPGTFLAGLELYEVAGPAGLDLIKLKIGHCLQGIWLIQLIMIFCYFNYIQILSIYKYSRDQDSLLLTWISNHMPSVGLNDLFIPKLQVLHFRARFSDLIFGFDIRTRYSDSIFGLDIRTRFSDLILRLDFCTWILNSDKLLHPAHYNGCNYRVATEFTENNSLTFPKPPAQILVKRVTNVQHWIFLQNIFITTPKLVNLWISWANIMQNMEPY